MQGLSQRYVWGGSGSAADSCTSGRGLAVAHCVVACHCCYCRLTPSCQPPRPLTHAGSYCVGGIYGGDNVPAKVPCGTNLTTLGFRATSQAGCGECTHTPHKWPAAGCGSSAERRLSRLQHRIIQHCIIPHHPHGAQQPHRALLPPCLDLAVNLPGTYYDLSPNNTISAVPCPVDQYGPGLKKQRQCIPCPTGFTTDGAAGQTSPSACREPHSRCQ